MFKFIHFSKPLEFILREQGSGCLGFDLGTCLSQSYVRILCLYLGLCQRFFPLFLRLCWHDLVSSEEANIRKFLCSLQSLPLVNFHGISYGAWGWSERVNIKMRKEINSGTWRSLTVWDALIPATYHDNRAKDEKKNLFRGKGGSWQRWDSFWYFPHLLVRQKPQRNKSWVDPWGPTQALWPT